MNIKDKKSILSAINKSDNQKLEHLINTQPQLIHVTNEYNYSLVQIACHNNNLDALKFLLSKGAQFEDTNTLLCASHGYEKILTYLIENNLAKVDMVDKRHETLLMIAVQEGHFHLVKMLLSHGADINAKNNDGKTALYFSVFLDEVEMAKYLINHGANLDSVETTKKPINPEVSNLILAILEKKQLEENLNTASHNKNILKL